MIEAKVIENSATDIRIMWVDDDPYVLSSVQRLLRQHNISVQTFENPREALKHLMENSYTVLISDQRMPGMTGIELLEKAKTLSPTTTRIMVTGFLESHLIEESVNRSGVFRFINKPWTDMELMSDIQIAHKHHLNMVQQNQLAARVREQNKQLTSLNENLEQLVFERTHKILESKKEVELKNNKIKNLITFIQDLNRAEGLEDLMFLFRKDFQSRFNILNSYLFYEHELNKKLLYFQKKEVLIKNISESIQFKQEIQYGRKDDQSFLAHNVGRPITNLITVPLPKSVSNTSQFPILFLEHDLTQSELGMFLDYLTERLQMIAIAVDRSLMYEKLKLDSLQWELTFDNFKEPIAIVDVEGNILRMNTAFDQFSKNLLPEELQLIEFARVQKIVRKISLSKNNKVYDLYCYPIQLLKNSNSTSFVNYYMDVTQKRELYGALIQNEKMVALGLLAGNIAHELNNPLTGIRSISQVLLKTQKLNENIKNDLVEVDKASERCQRVISDLLLFSQEGETNAKFDKVDLREIVLRTLPFLKTALRYHNVSVRQPEQPVWVTANFHLAQQVVFNLLNNARQAMDDPGDIVISIQKEKSKGLLTIQDSGSGIDPSVIDKIFDPFFTTKREGEGTGLGLSVCKAIVEKMNGDIHVDSQLGHGTKFCVMLPEWKDT